MIRERFIVFMIVVGLAFAFLGLVVNGSDRDTSISLTDLNAVDHGSVPPAPPGSHDGRLWPANLEVELIFYGVLGLCGVLLALRSLISAARVRRVQGSATAQRLARYALSNAKRAEIEDATAVWQPLSEPAAGPNHAAAQSSWASRPGPALRLFPNRLWSYIVSQGHGLTAKMIVAFAAIIAAFGLLTIATLGVALMSSLKQHAIERASIAALHISGRVPGYVFAKNFTELREFLRHHGSRPGVAYVLVENRNGMILAHSLSVLPQELEHRSPSSATSDGEHHTLKLGRGTVYEVAVPVSAGESSVLRLGIWGDEVDAEILRTLMPPIKIIAWTLGGGILLVIFLAWKINRPIGRLIHAARSISRGDLDTPALVLEDNTEFGELSRALERLRSSVKAAMNRLSQER